MADGASNYRPRRPSSTPSQGSLSERDAFIALSRQSLPEVRASAEAWRNGLSAFLTLVTAGVIIKGRDTTAGLPVSWRILITGLIGAGLALAVAGLWRVLAAHAGTRYRLSTRQDIRQTYGTVEAYQLAVAERATDDLSTGRRLVFAALALLLISVGVNWWAPPASTSPPAYLRATFNNTDTCGVPQLADNGQLWLATSSSHDPVVIPLAQITSLAVVPSCA